MPGEAMSDELAEAMEAATRWALHDPDHVTRGRLDRLVDDADPELVGLFTGRVSFGTAGLRAEVGPGPNRMNALVVRQTTVAVVRWLQRTIERPKVLIGFDARRDSESFGSHAAAAVVASGGEAHLADAVTPTPVVAHQLLASDADAAIVITASHNPPDDNGYKLYLGDGMQIVSPVEGEIAGLIDEVAANWAAVGPSVDDAHAGLGAQPTVIDAQTWIGAHRRSALAALDELTGTRERASALTIVYTAMHGVGGAPMVAAFDGAGFGGPIVVESQFSPNPDFPTVSFPNPEEPGALDEAIRIAEREHADVIVAHDPDADRLALAVPAPGGGFARLSGDELGSLLADHLLRHTESPERALVARSVVSSRLLDAIAEHYGAESIVTLTGFKWIARAADQRPERNWLLGYEEALGYCIGTHVRDKDGITAALIAADLLDELAGQSATVWDRLDELATRHGVYESRPITRRFDDQPERIAEVITAWAATPPERVGPMVVTTAGSIGGGALPATPGVQLNGRDRSQIILRPSGTEPKVKVYIEVIEQGDDIAAARAAAIERLDAIAAAIEDRLG